MNTITAGKVPGAVRQIMVEDGATVLQVMEVAARECGFTFLSTAYSTNGREMVDVPFLNGRELATRDGEKISSVHWDTPVANGDVVLLVPKIKGNQFLVTVGRIPGATGQYALLECNAPEADLNDGRVTCALTLADITLTADEVVEVNGVVHSLDCVDCVLHDGDTVIVKQAPVASLEAEEIGEPEAAITAAITDYFRRLEHRLKALETKTAALETAGQAEGGRSVLAKIAKILRGE